MLSDQSFYLLLAVCDARREGLVYSDPIRSLQVCSLTPSGRCSGRPRARRSAARSRRRRSRLNARGKSSDPDGPSSTGPPLPPLKPTHPMNSVFSGRALLRAEGLAMSNVIRFPNPTFSLLSATSDGFYVGFAFRRDACPIEVVGPFSTPCDAFEWATKTGARGASRSTRHRSRGGGAAIRF